MDAQERYRAVTKDYELASDRLRQAKSTRTAYWLILLCGATLAFLLAYSVAIGLWRDQPILTRYVGLLALLILCVVGGRQLIRVRRDIVGLDLDVRNLGHDRQTAATKIELESVQSLRIYREASQDVVNQFRTRAGRNRRIHNLNQAVVIVGSIAASTTTALLAEGHPLGWVATALTTTVSVTAGLAAYFKFRERSYNLQSTADEIERNYNASQFRLDDYENDTDEASRLRRFAKNVERLREEQRKRELQLEQSSGKTEDRA
ncbi:DUF4231 domain-containing protein [Actinoplanes sp. NPDC024001]|uniref:DUF4231 domain-containing protein n=1 Tax=Actinoplanes sp. NPDC024001 TaxID=3154598 RepID=UPI00340F7B6D